MLSLDYARFRYCVLGVYAEVNFPSILPVCMRVYIIYTTPLNQPPALLLAACTKVSERGGGNLQAARYGRFLGVCVIYILGVFCSWLILRQRSISSVLVVWSSSDLCALSVIACYLIIRFCRFL